MKPLRSPTRQTAAAILLVLAAASPARACHTALLLAVDVSNSIDPSEYRIQADGIAAALGDPVVINAMVEGRNALAIMQWSGLGMQELVVRWTQVTSAADMAALAERARTMPRAYLGSNTALGEALRDAVTVALQPPGCDRRVVDVSGDGADNAGTDVNAARRFARASGVTVNGLAIEGLGPAITTYFRRTVITPDGFVETARGFDDFARAIRTKIRREVSRVSG